MLIAPASRIADSGAALPQGRFETLILTSENGLEAFCRRSPRRDLTAWCVGPHTTAAAAERGFAVRQGPGDGAGLAAAILAARPPGPCLWPHGDEIAFDLGGALNSAGIETFPALLYRSESVAPSAAALALLADEAPVILPVFSPRGADWLAGWTAGRRAPLVVVAISPATGLAAADLRPERLVVAKTPDAEAMLAAMAPLLAAKTSP